MSKYLGEDDLVLNTSSRIPVCLCIDTSASMRRVIDGTGRDTGETEFVDGKHWRIVEGGKNLLDNMNEGLEAFYKAINSNEQAKLSCELAVVTFDDEARVLEDFGTLDKKRPVRISETGDNTALGEGISLALKLLETRKREYRKNGVDYYQPWLVIFTDGDASDSVAEARQKIRSLEEEKKTDRVYVCPVGRCEHESSRRTFEEKAHFSENRQTGGVFRVARQERQHRFHVAGRRESKAGYLRHGRLGRNLRENTKKPVFWQKFLQKIRENQET